jgi:hypothetical protein
MHPVSWVVALAGFALASCGSGPEGASPDRRTQETPSRGSGPVDRTSGRDSLEGSAVKFKETSSTNGERAALPIRITYFECADEAKEPEPRTKRAPGAPVDKGKRLSRWEAGGPAGASWNAGDLYCPVAIEVECTKGRVQIELRVGRALAETRSLRLSGSRKTAASLLVKEEFWRRNLDDLSSSYRKIPIRTAIVRLGVILTCESPVQVYPGTGDHEDFAADASFVAGFASGE